jgi:hypothetical protein
MPDPTKITDHVAQAQDRLLTQFRDSPKLNALLEAVVTEVQLGENVIFEVIAERLIAVAEGVNLDIIGRIVGLERLDVSDDDEYRELLLVQIRANNSDCGADDIIFIASELTGVPVRYTQTTATGYYSAHYHLEYVVDPPLSDEWLARINDLLELVTCSGVSYEMVEGDSPDAFRFDSGPGFDQGKLGNLVGQFS